MADISADKDGLSVKFWGTRGSIPTPGPRTIRYGGNTTCLEIRYGDNRIVIDGGSGLRELANGLIADPPDNLNVYFTHTHWDHVCGIPFVPFCYMPQVRTRFHAAHLAPRKTLRDVLKTQMLEPLFPVPIEAFNNCEFEDFGIGDSFDVAGGLKVKTGPLNHPNGACGYRFDYAGKSIAVITDTEHKAGIIDENVLALADKADIMIYDAMYDEARYARHVGWGHSTWEECLRVADAAGVKQAVLFHHDPNHDDERMDAIVAQAAAIRPGTIAAQEGQVLWAG